MISFCFLVADVAFLVLPCDDIGRIFVFCMFMITATPIFGMAASVGRVETSFASCFCSSPRVFLAFHRAQYGITRLLAVCLPRDHDHSCIDRERERETLFNFPH